ncbi:hypothetical protein ABEB36_009331 [Hypothenemus hampei]|uniref:Uncharacterized protein n=1 Tax=Hypothenemus hampei TaxID=57062 RepID=A0ABD1EG90_HYPHA
MVDEYPRGTNSSSSTELQFISSESSSVHKDSEDSNVIGGTGIGNVSPCGTGAVEEFKFG